MKTLLLIRHAKSSWEDFTVTDEERPLNERGKLNAPEMARRLWKKNIPIDLFLSSPAKRAKATAEYFAKAYKVPSKEINIIPSLYIANHEAFLETIKNAADKASSIAIFSHNSGITDFVNSLSSAHIDEMPTCGVFAVKCPIQSWKDFKTGENEFFFFDYPKSQ